jgi:hypothetical protein
MLLIIEASLLPHSEADSATSMLLAYGFASPFQHYLVPKTIAVG